MKTKLKQKIPLMIMIGVVVGSIFFILFPSLQSHPLGEKVQYVGVESFGRAPLTDSSRYDLYYYGTNLSPEELALYFHATLSQPSGDLDEYSLSLPSGEKVTVKFQDKNNSSAPNFAKDISTKYLFYIHDQDYNNLKKSL